MAIAAAMSGVPYALQSAAASGNGNTVAPPHTFKNHHIEIKGSAGVSAGAVQVEVNNDSADSNTWAPMGGGPVTVVASTDISVDFTGVYLFIRARISTPIANGTVTVNYLGGRN